MLIDACELLLKKFQKLLLEHTFKTPFKGPYIVGGDFMSTEQLEKEAEKILRNHPHCKEYPILTHKKLRTIRRKEFSLDAWLEKKEEVA